MPEHDLVEIFTSRLNLLGVAYMVTGAVASGAEVIIVEEGTPLARISPIEASVSKIRFGVLKGKAKVAEDFDAPSPDEMLSEFEGSRCAS